MRPQFRLRLRRRPVLITTTATAAMLAAAPVFAQRTGDNNNNNDNEDDEEADDPPATNRPTANRPAPTDNQDDEPAPEPTNPPATETEADEPPPEETNEPEPEPEPEEEDEPEPTTKTQSEPEPEPTDEDEPEPTDEEEPEPPETTEAPEPTQVEDDGEGGLTDAPSLTRGFGIPTYPAASVPPTYHAPFMQHSRAPDGTVFIAVGAILGAFGLAILLWRVIVGLLLHRSVERAAMAQHDVNSKTGFPAPPAPFYKYTDQSSNKSLNGGAAAGRGVKRTNRGPIPSSNPSQSNLFFSPTAAVGGNSGNRGSAFLPSGFYAAGAGSGSPSHQHSISLTNLRPDSRGHGAPRNTLGPTPPDSPAFSPTRRDLSTSSLNLGNPSGQRAPSAYLDDLLADDPGSLPPPHGVPSPGPRSPSNLGPGGNRF